MMIFVHVDSRQNIRCPLPNPEQRHRAQSGLPTAPPGVGLEGCKLPVPRAQAARVLHETTVVSLPPVKHPCPERKEDLVGFMPIVAKVARHEGLRAAGAAEMGIVLPT